MNEPVIVLGAATFAETVDEWCRAAEIPVIGFTINQSDELNPKDHVGLPVHWCDKIDNVALVNGIFSPKRREFIEYMEVRGHKFRTVIHPDASVAVTARVSKCGVVIGPGAVIEHKAIIEPHVVVNRGSLVGHHTRLMSYTSLGPGANLAGGIEVEPGVLIGMGACVLPRLIIGRNSVVGANSTVVASVKINTTVVGSPATELYSHENYRV